MFVVMLAINSIDKWLQYTDGEVKPRNVPRIIVNCFFFLVSSIHYLPPKNR